jgi:zinc D-Ala-D-Ala carboxypeptidase
MISKHFSIKEASYSYVAVRNNINNTLPPDLIFNAKIIAESILEPVREHFKIPFSPSSWYRSERLNNLLNGSMKSQHLLALAVDFEVPGVSNLDLAKWIHVNLDYDQLILEFHIEGAPSSGWVHASFVSPPSENRKQFLITPDGNNYKSAV